MHLRFYSDKNMASFVERKSEGRSEEYPAPAFSTGEVEALKFEEVSGDDDLPF